MKLTLERTTFGTAATLGTLSIDGTFYCDTLEDVDRKLEDDPDAKIPGETAIPRGTYHVKITYSTHFGREMPILLDVENYVGVRIHPGNSDKDTEGCILVGKATGLADWIENSKAAFEPLFGMIEATLDAGEAVTIEVL